MIGNSELAQGADSSAGNEFHVALERLHQNRLLEAENLCAAILRTQPDFHPARQLLAAAAAMAGDSERALAQIDAAIQLAPTQAEYHDNRSVILFSVQQFQPAEAAARTAISLSPELPEGHYNLARALRELGRHEECEQEYRTALLLRPGFAQAANNLGNLLRMDGKLDEAEMVLRNAIRLNPAIPEAENNLGAVLQAKHRLDEAAEAFRRAIAIRPDFWEAANNLGAMQQTRGRIEDAIAAYQLVLAARPDFVPAAYNLAIAERQLGRLAEAEKSLRRAIAIQPQFAEAHAELAQLYLSQGRLTAAELECQKALEIRPQFAPAMSTHGKIRLIQGRPDEAFRMLSEAETAIDSSMAIGSTALFCMHYCPEITPTELRTAHLRWYESFATMTALTSKAATRISNRGPVRVGFVSADLCDHPVGEFLIDVLERLPPGEFSTVCYSGRLGANELSERFRRASTIWRDSWNLSDEALAAQIRDDAIDVLFDLSGHSGQNRLLVFARRPAAVQASWLGYPGTTGVAEIDFLVADRFLVPPGSEADYSESIAQLPDGNLCFTPPTSVPSVSRLPAISNGYVTFGSFNNTAKLNGQVVRTWARILRRLPNARLCLQYHWFSDGSVRDQLTTRFVEAGVAKERLEMSSPVSKHEFMAKYQQIDIALDPFPYSGCRTTCEALWMGVPVITLPGITFASRQSLSLLANAELSEFVASDRDDYVEIASRTANSLDRLAELRQQLRHQLRSSPLCDRDRFVKNFAAMVRNWTTEPANRGEE